LRKTVFGIMLSFLIISTLTSAFNVQPVKAWTGTIYIRADGSIDPPDAPITTYDNVTYTLTGNITSTADGIVVERDNIIIDGAGYGVQGTGKEAGKTGINLSSRKNVMLKKIKVRDFCYGIYLDQSSSNVLIGNTVLNNEVGIFHYQSSSNILIANSALNNSFGIYLSDAGNFALTDNTVSYNYCGLRLDKFNSSNVTDNTVSNNYYGILMLDSSSNNIFHNNFVNNTIQVNIVFVTRISVNTWDNGYPSGGNYWSDYTGVDLYSGPNQDIPSRRKLE
jgi:parallel beta-helix repeat protein